MTRRALVLGAGGEAGIAWEVGLLAGLAAHGVDLTAADLVVGTSAGAGVAARMNSGIGLAALYEQQLVSADGEIVTRMGPRAIAGFLWATGLAPPQPGPGPGSGLGGWRCGRAPGPRRRGAPFVAARLGTHDWPAGSC
jgi:NTE family protein